MQNLAILGSTGSIGQSALSLVDLYPERFNVVALAAGSNRQLIYEQCLKYRPHTVALYDQEAARELAGDLPAKKVVSGIGGVTEVACHPEADLVLSSVMGAAGLEPTYHAIREGKKIALANKETLVMAGDLLMPMIEHYGASLVPVDSEHSALHQCLEGSRPSEIRRLLLTASGGPFLRLSTEELRRVTVSEALDHPTWQMGPKITIDSATLMNKGLEVIEAYHLFGAAPEQISVVIHPQSAVHSFVEFIDGTMLAQFSITDMRTCLLYAFAYPERWESRLPDLDLASLGQLSFQEPDRNRFPCLQLAYDALEKGQSYPIVLNASNEVAVDSFLKGKISFHQIPRIIQNSIDHHSAIRATCLADVLDVDREIRRTAEEFANSLL